MIISAIQPTGTITLGNYLGAIKSWQKLQSQDECLFFIANLHALTNLPPDLKTKSYETLSLLLACGIEPNNLFLQSMVPYHAELNWILTCQSSMGELKRMVQFKDKSATIDNAGLFIYPCLQASDILLYNAKSVPIGQDQTQHLELTANLAHRFNQRYGEVFTIPKPLFNQNTKKIMHLLDPTVKMSKSHPNQNGVINLLDDASAINNKFKRAVTDSLGSINYHDSQPGIKNLLDIANSCTTGNVDIASFANKYGRLKQFVADTVINELSPIQTKYKQYLNDKDFLDSVLIKGAEKAKKVASSTMELVYQKLGLK